LSPTRAKEPPVLSVEEIARTCPADWSCFRVLVIGPPGAGKGTQCRILSERYGIRHISTGDLLRAAIAAETPLGRAAGRYVAAGLLVPDRLVLRLVNEAIDDVSAGADRARGFLLDGVPRTIQQAEALDALLAAQRIDAVVHVEVPDRVARLRHCARGREDDGDGTVRRRFDVYRRLTLPMVAWMSGRRPVLPVDGTGPVERVTEAIVRGLSTLEPVGAES
jgi:adenylate kinase